jgi:thiol-disulfide isomerase/thioredoxin
MAEPETQNPHSNPSADSTTAKPIPRWKSLLRNHGITLVLLIAFGYFWMRPPATVTDENRAAPAWAVQLTDGRTLTSEQLKGKVVLVNYWATWCPYCLKEMPVIEEFLKDHRAKGFEVLAVSVDDPPAKVSQYMKDHGYAFMAAPMDPSVYAAFGRADSIPTSFVVDANGVIRHKIAGQVHYPRLEKLVVPLLSQAKLP